jgi:glucan phosphoethanolaminetransferase (alkaline phosphatase superfamily)
LAVFLLGVIFLIFLISFFNWILSSNKKIFKEKVRLVIIFVSLVLALIFLIFGLYYFSTFFISLAIWFFKRKLFFDFLLGILKRKKDPSMHALEAYELLGVDKYASNSDIIKKHKELISRLHPDKGGSSYLSSRINEARDTIMKERENGGEKSD